MYKGKVTELAFYKSGNVLAVLCIQHIEVLNLLFFHVLHRRPVDTYCSSTLKDKDKAVIVLYAHIPLIDTVTYQRNCKFQIFIAHFCKEFLS